MDEEKTHFVRVFLLVMKALELVLLEELQQVARENVLEDEELGHRKMMEHNALPTRLGWANARAQNWTERIGLNLIDAVHQRGDLSAEQIQRESGVHHLHGKLGVLLSGSRNHTQKTTEVEMASFKRCSSLLRFKRIAWFENSSPDGITSCSEQ